jgi:hypothetical protein
MPPDDYVADLPVQEPNEIESITTFVSAHPVLTLGGLVALFMGYMLMRSRIPGVAAVATPAEVSNPRGRRRKSRRY